MSRDTRNGVILAVLLAALALLWYRVWQEGQAGPPAEATAVVPGGSQAALPAAAPRSVDLAALSADRPAASPARRNLFQYGTAMRSPAGPAAPVFDVPPPVPAVVAPAEPAEPTLTLKLIGIVRPLDESPRVAVLSDERGVYHGTEGTIIEGRYRIVRVDAQAVELSTLDGSGHFVLRMPPS